MSAATTELGRPHPVIPRRSEDSPRPRKRLCTFSTMLPVLALLAAHVSGVNAAEFTAKAGELRAKPRSTLDPEQEAKLAEFLKKAREAKRVIWVAQTKKRIENLASVASLEPERANALERLSERAIELSLDEWIARAGDGWRQWAQQVPNESPEVFDQALARVEQSVQSDWFGDYVRPLEQPKWEEGLRAALTAEQLAAWKKMVEERKQTVLKEIDGPFQLTVESTREQQKTALTKKGAAIVAALNLPKERAAQLDALAGSVVDAFAEKWKTRVQRNLLWMEDEQRQQIVQAGRFYIRADEKEIKARETAWDEGVEKLLKPEETKRLRATHGESRERRIAALTEILIAQLDEQVAFTTGERERLRAIAEREIRTEATLISDAVEEGYYRIDLRKLLGCGRAVEDEELKTILDETQRKRWKDACSGKSVTPRSSIGMARVIGAVSPAAPVTQPARPGEPEDLENAISDHLHEKAVAERQRLLAIHLLKAEDAARVGGLAPEVARRLATAARGTAEEELTAWKTATDQSIRSQLRDVTPENVKQRLASLDRYVVGRRTSSGSAVGTFWDASVKAELTDTQRAAWQKEVDARGAYRDQAITGLIVAELDRRQSLKAEQWIRLEPLIATMVKEYGPDIASMFSYSAGNIWYLQSHTMFVPVAAIPEKDLKAILTKEQWERWTSSSEFGNTTNYWENVQRMHATRVRVKKP